MAGSLLVLYRNYNDSDNIINDKGIQAGQNFPYPQTLGWQKEGCVFKEWNTYRDGSGTGYAAGSASPLSGASNFYAIWEASSSSKLIVTKSELEAIADAIRAKTGQSGDLTYPNGFVSAINSIQGV